MVNRLQPLNLVDFTGGINLRPETFQLAENELPFMLNLEVDPRGGINTRNAWVATNLAVATGTWNPRNAYLHRQADGDELVLVANRVTSTNVEVRAITNTLTVTMIVNNFAGANPHAVDFASWDDIVYMARGSSTSVYWDGTAATATALTQAGNANWQNDYTTPGATDTAPRADLVAQHQGYMFWACTMEDGNAWPNRIRWSHPNNPRRYASSDFIDISEGGQRITAIMPFSDRLLIFKPDSVWALFGYDADTWEVVNISRTIGCLNQQLVARSESAVFFLSWPHGIFGYTEKANIDELSVQIRTVFEGHDVDPVAMANAWMGWVGRRLWVSLPWKENTPSPADAVSAFVFDPVLASWTLFRGAGDIVPGPYVERIEARDRQAQQTFVRQRPYLVALDGDSPQAVDECTPGTLEEFSTAMRTRWLDAGHPTWKKSWRRPDFLLRALTYESTVAVQVFHDFDNFNAERSFLIAYTPDNPGSLYGDFEWGDGTLYGGSDQSSSVERGGTMGRAGTVQLQCVGNPGVRWGLNGIVFKFIPRRFR